MANPAIPAEPAASAAAGRAPAASPAASAASRLIVLVVAAAASAVGAYLGAWWVPFLAGAAVGIGQAATRQRVGRGSVLPAVVGAVVGWLLPVWVLALRGQPAGATARAVAGLAGLPPYAGVTVAVLALLAALQVWVGAWLARAVAKAIDRSNPAEPQT